MKVGLANRRSVETLSPTSSAARSRKATCDMAEVSIRYLFRASLLLQWLSVPKPLTSRLLIKKLCEHDLFQ